jgi:hypothetical protein
MHRLLRILLSLACLLVGVILFVLPWSRFWERNFFLDRFPALIPYLLNPYLRGAITGLGLLDVGIAAAMLLGSRKPDAVA